MSVEFQDNSMKVKGELEDVVIAWLYAASDEINSTTQRNTRVGEFEGYDVKGNWKRVVDESNKEARVGSNLEAAFWEELGTGEYAVNKDGRKGWWVYVEGNSQHPSRQPIRTQEEAEGVAASLRASGLPAHATNGTKANRPLLRAFTAKKSWAKKELERMLKERFG